MGGFVAAAAAGWILCKKTPSEERLKSFLTGWSTSGGGGAGPGAGLVRADGGEMAMEIGVTTPGGGATRGYGKFIGDVLHEAARNGIPGGDMIGRYADWTQFWINYNRNGGRSR